MAEVKLLSHWASAFGMRVELALKAKGIKYEYLQQDLFNKSELLLTSNPVYKKIPVLIHRGKPICESRIIMEYIEETWPAKPRLLPDDPCDRYLVRFWSDFMDKKSTEILNQLFGLKLKSEEERMILIKKVQEEYAEMGMTMERGIFELEQRGCLYDGKSLKYMDVFFAPSVSWFAPTQELLGLTVGEIEECPCLYKWTQNLMTNEVVRSTIPEAGKLREYANIVMG